MFVQVHPIEDRPEAIAPPWFDRVDVDNLDIEELQSWCADNHENLYSLVRMKMKLGKRQRLRGKHKLRVLKQTLMLFRRSQPKVTVYDVEAFAERWEIESKTLKTLKPDDLLTEEYFQEMLLLLTYCTNFPEIFCFVLKYLDFFFAGTGQIGRAQGA